MSTAAAPDLWAAGLEEKRRRLAGWVDARRRRHAEARAWYQAGPLEELAALTARWLRGQMLWQRPRRRPRP